MGWRNRFKGLALLAAFAIPVSLSAAQHGVKLTTPNFELYTTAGDKRGRQAILYFEQVRSFFLKIGIGHPPASHKVRIVGFQSAKEYAPYRPGEHVFAYYQPGYDRDYIVMRSLDSGAYPVAIHEYVHLLVRHSGAKLPVWLNEGLAELYSTLEPIAKKVKVGKMIPGRLDVLQRSKLLDLQTLTSVDHDSPYYNEGKRTDIFYAESWALTHMLQLSDAYRPGAGQFFQAISDGMEPVEAFQQVFRKSPAQIQKELEGYIRASSYNVVLFDTQLEKSSENPEVAPASAPEVGLALADLLYGLDKREAADQMLADLSAQHPASSELASAQAYSAWRKRLSLEEIEPLFAKAVELGSTSAKLHFDYAMMLARDRENEVKMTGLLRKALELQPDFKEARMALGTALYNQRLYAQAVASLNMVKQVERQEALRMFRILAHSYYELGQKEDARKSAERLREISRTPYEIEEAEDLLRYVSEPETRFVEDPLTASRPENVEEEAAAEPPPVPVPASGERPRLLRRPPPESTFLERPAPTRPRVRIEATLFQFDCLGESARLTVLFSGRRVAFAIRDPLMVKITGAESPTLDFSCGRQQPLPVLIEFEEKVDGELGTTGDITAIEFQ